MPSGPHRPPAAQRFWLFRRTEGAGGPAGAAPGPGSAKAMNFGSLEHMVRGRVRMFLRNTVLVTIVGTIGYVLAGWHDRALLPPLSLGFVSLIGVVIMAPVSSLAAPYGARLAHRLSRRTLELAFSIFLLLIAARFLVSMF